MNKEPVQAKEIAVCERHVVYLQVHCVHLSYEAVPTLFASQGSRQTCSLAQGEQGHSDEPAGTGPAPSLSHTQMQSLFKAGPSRDTTLQSRTGMV